MDRRVVHHVVLDSLQPVVEEAQRLRRPEGPVGILPQPAAAPRPDQDLLAPALRARVASGALVVDVPEELLLADAREDADSVVDGDPGALDPGLVVLATAFDPRLTPRARVDAVAVRHLVEGIRVTPVLEQRRGEHRTACVRFDRRDAWIEVETLDEGDVPVEELPVDAVGEDVLVPVERRHLGHDRPQVGRSRARDLELHPAGIRDPVEPDVAVAPRLRREPLGDVVAVGPVLRVAQLVPRPEGCTRAPPVGDADDVAVRDQPVRRSVGGQGANDRPGREFRRAMIARGLPDNGQRIGVEVPVLRRTEDVDCELRSVSGAHVLGEAEPSVVLRLRIPAVLSELRDAGVAPARSGGQRGPGRAQRDEHRSSTLQERAARDFPVGNEIGHLWPPSLTDWRRAGSPSDHVHRSAPDL